MGVWVEGQLPTKFTKDIRPLIEAQDPGLYLWPADLSIAIESESISP